jgi:hypothetical protein
MSLSPRQRYAQRVLELYRWTPGTAGLARRCDRGLAATLYDRGIPLKTVHTALLLAAGRRACRPSDALPLAPIATLHYFLPIIDELIARPLEQDYLQYLRHNLSTLAPALVAAFDHQIP